MSDQSTQPLATGIANSAPAGTPGQDDTAVQPPSNLATAISSTIASAPEVARSPGLAVGIASSGGDTVARSQAVARGTNVISDSNAHTTVDSSVGGDLSHALSWFGDTLASVASNPGEAVVGGIKQAGSDVMNVMNKPLAIAQHEYRYLHDVEATHGMDAAIAEGLAIAGAGVAGTVATGGNVYAGALASEAAAGVLGQVLFKDSWNRTSSSTYTDPHTNQQVSLGRDIASTIGLRPNTTVYRLSSGLIDGLFDMNVGGTEVLGLMKDAKSAEGLGGILASRWGGTAIHTVGDAVGGAPVTEASEIDRIYNQYPGIRRAWDRIGTMSEQDLIADPSMAPYRQIFPQLARAQDGEAVGQVFKDVMRTQELAFTDRLPSMSWTRLHFGTQLRESIGQMNPNVASPFEAPLESALHPVQAAQGMAARQLQRVTALPVSFDAATKSMSLHQFDPASRLDDGTHGIFNMLRFTEDVPTAASTASAYHNMADLGQKVLAYRNITLNSLFAMGNLRNYTNADFTMAPNVAGYLKDSFSDPKARQAMAKALDEAVGGGMFGKDAWYGVDDASRNLSKVKASNGDATFAAAIWKNQTGKLAYLDLRAARRAGAQLAGARDVLGHLDDFAYDNITQGIFKPLVLLTPSYALHISLAELIPNMLREGAMKTIRSAIVGNIAHLGYRVGEYQAGTAASKSILDQLTSAQARGLSENTIARLSAQYEAILKETEDKKVGAIAGLVWDSVTAGMKKAPTRIDAALAKQLESRAVMLEATGGDQVASGAASAHAYQAEYADRESNVVSLLRRKYFNSPMKSDGMFGTIGDGNHDYFKAWRSAIREVSDDVTGQKAAQELIAGGKRGESLEDASITARKLVAGHLRDVAESDPEQVDWALRKDPQVTASVSRFAKPPDWDNYDEWAHVKVQSLRGVVRGRDGTMNAGILSDIAEGKTPSHFELEALPEENRPVIVKAREMLPDGTGTIQKIANVGFRNVLNPMVNFLSRQPIFGVEWDRQWAAIQPFIASGMVDRDEAINIALNRSVNRVLRNVHNLTDRTQWTVTMRNWAPFYFAQEQAYRRMGRLLAENPRAFRQYQLMISNIGNMGQVFQGKDNNNYFVMPGTGWLTGAASALGALTLLKIPMMSAQPIGLGWNLSASSVIFPLSAGVRPDLGPVVAIPTQALEKAVASFLPASLQSDGTTTLNTLLGPAGNESIVSNLVPNTILQRFLEGRFTGFDERSFNSTAMQTLQTLDYEHKIPNPTEMLNPRLAQQFIDRWRNQTQIMYVAKAIVGAVTPVSPELQVKNLDLPTELANDITSSGSLNRGVTKFLAKYPDATPFTVWQSGSQEGISVPASVAAEKYINDNMPLINNPKYGNAVLLLMPPNTDATYNASVYTLQQAQGIRAKLAPFESTGNGQFPSYLNQLYISAGNAIVEGQWYPQFEKQLAGMTPSEKYTAEQNFYGSGTPNTPGYVPGTIGSYAALNPIWGEWYNSGTRETQRGALINQMRSLLDGPDAPNTKMANETRILIQKYDAVQEQSNSGSADGRSAQSASQMNQQWKDDLYATVAAHPELTNVVTGLFLSIPQTGQVVPASAPGEGQQPGSFTAKNWQAA